MMLLSALYGGVHLSLWNYDFPTRTEVLLWRISAIALGSLPGYFFGVGVIGLAIVYVLSGLVMKVASIFRTIRAKRPRGVRDETEL